MPGVETGRIDGLLQIKPVVRVAQEEDQSPLVLLIAACNRYPHQYVEGEEGRFPRIRFADHSLSVNDRCPVTLKRLHPRWDPVYVNGRSVGFC